jgi:hypothetical protein
MKHGILPIVAVVALAGCARDPYAARDIYEITVRPQGKVFQRRLTCWHKRRGHDPKIEALDADELARLEKLYGGRESDDDATKQTFVAEFEGRVPPDVGGAGTYSHWTTPLGSVTAYMERLRGQVNPEIQWKKQRAAADQIVDLLAGSANTIGQYATYWPLP